MGEAEPDIRIPPLDEIYKPVREELRERFGARADANIKAMERAYNEVVVKE